MSARVYEAINDQVNNELSASHSYLAMSGVCEELNFPGAAHWFRVQSEEERGHALRLFDFVHRYTVGRLHRCGHRDIREGIAGALRRTRQRGAAQSAHTSKVPPAFRRPRNRWRR